MPLNNLQQDSHYFSNKSPLNDVKAFKNVLYTKVILLFFLEGV